MHPAVQQHVMRQIAAAPLIAEPFPHFYQENVFPDEFYEEMLARLPSEENLTCHGESGLVAPGTYEERFIFRLDDGDLAKLGDDDRRFWGAIRDWLDSDELLTPLLGKFGPHIEARFNGQATQLRVKQDSMLVRDIKDYALGPHTDARHRLLTMLFYLPADAGAPELGTSLYRPLDPAFRCEGGPHYPFDQFERIATVDYKPNAMFGFLKTDASFHGVEPVAKPEARRDMLMYELKIKALTLRRPSA